MAITSRPSTASPLSRAAGGLTWLLAPALILGGGLWGHFGKVRGHQLLRLKQPVDQFMTEGGGQVPYSLPGFAVELESLRPDPPEPAFRLLVPDGKEGRSIEVKEGLKGSLPGGFTFEMEKLLPNALDQGEVRDNPEAPENPALKVMLGVGAPEPVVGMLFSRRGAAARHEEPGGRFGVAFQDTWSPELLASLGPRPPTVETLQVVLGGQTLDHSAALGGTWAFPTFRLRVVRAFPDFAVRPDAKGNPQPGTKSEKPLDPWLELTLETPDGSSRRVLLSARNPEVTDSLNAPNLPEGMSLRYVRSGEERQTRFVVFTRDDQKIRLVEDRQISRMEPLRLNHPFIVAPGLSVTALQALAHAEILHAFVPHPDPAAATRYERPALRLRVSELGKGPETTLWLDARLAGGEPEVRTLFGGRLRLALQPKPLEPADLKPVISMRSRDGRELARRELGANMPFVYDGHAFCLARELPAEPGAIDLQLTREPGLGLVYLGCSLLFLGLLWLFLLEPRWLRHPRG